METFKNCLKKWMKDNRHSSYTFADLLWEKHKVKVSPETVQRWMAGRTVSEPYRKAVAKETKLKLPKKTSGKVTPASFVRQPAPQSPVD